MLQESLHRSGRDLSPLLSSLLLDRALRLSCLQCLHLFPKQPTAVRSTTATGHLAVAQGVQLVVEGQLGASWNVSEGEQADSRLSVNHPLLGLKVGLAAVIDEPARKDTHTD